MSLASRITAQIDVTQAGALDLGSAIAKISAGVALQLASGVGANQADQVFSDERVITASSSENLDLAGVLADALGATLTFAKIKAILVVADAANTNDVVVGGAASNGFTGPFGGATHTVAVKPGGVFMAACPGTGWTVTPSTGDILKVANGGGTTSVKYKVIIVGTSS